MNLPNRWKTSPPPVVTVAEGKRNDNSHSWWCCSCHYYWEEGQLKLYFAYIFALVSAVTTCYRSHLLGEPETTIDTTPPPKPPPCYAMQWAQPGQTFFHTECQAGKNPGALGLSQGMEPDGHPFIYYGCSKWIIWNLYHGKMGWKSPNIHFIYLEPKWHLFWLERALFWRGWPSIKRDQLGLYMEKYPLIPKMDPGKITFHFNFASTEVSPKKLLAVWMDGSLTNDLQPFPKSRLGVPSYNSIKIY